MGRENLSDSETDNESDSDVALWERGCQGSVPAAYESSNGCRVSDLGMIDRIPAALVAAVTPLLPGPPCDWTAQPLPVDCILSRILRVQKLEQTGSDRVYEAYRTVTRIHHLRAGNFTASDYGYVAGMLGAGSRADPRLSSLHHYLLATTAKDCSVMLAFQRLPQRDYRYALHHHCLVLCTRGCPFVYLFCLGLDCRPKFEPGTP
jgi:hypothetical protein